MGKLPNLSGTVYGNCDNIKQHVVPETNTLMPMPLCCWSYTDDHEGIVGNIEVNDSAVHSTIDLMDPRVYLDIKAN